MRAESSSSSDTFPPANYLRTIPCCFWWLPPFTSISATDTVLHYIAPEIDWTLVGIDERWRDSVRVIFRKRAAARNLPVRQKDGNEAAPQKMCTV
jgi:hypothetical protein